MKCIAVAVFACLMAYCHADDIVVAEPLDFDSSMAMCPYGYNLISCECNPTGACQTVSVKPDLESSGLCHASAKFGGSAKAKATCKKGAKTRMAVAFENKLAKCPDGMKVNQCLAYSKPWRKNEFTVLATEEEDNGCKIKGPVSEEVKHSSSFFVQAICLA